MQITLSKFFVVFLFVNLLVWATFVLPPVQSYLFFSFVSVFVLPPFVIVGVMNTRGVRQAFFLGAMISGVGHYIISVYQVAMLGVGITAVFDTTGDDLGGVVFYHQIFIGLGVFGGLIGMASYKILGLGTTGESKSEMEDDEPSLQNDSQDMAKRGAELEEPVRLPR